MPRRVTIAHSPDADDAFMFYGLASGRVADPELELVQVLADIQTLNERALRGEYEVTAVSFHAYAHLTDRYLLLPHGASMGDAYGPVVVARVPLTREALRAAPVAVPGGLTTAALLLRFWDAALTQTPAPFDRILEDVLAGRAAAGLVIHEGQVTYASLGLVKIVDLGEWWTAATGLPLPLGGNVIRRDLGAPLRRRLSALLRDSIAFSLAHRAEALDYAMQYARGVDRVRLDRFVEMYVNDLTVAYGARGREAVARLFAFAYERGALPRFVTPEFVD
ncbi:MAG TPA: MqnA/MqnD/SBP family protein [Candidatus Sulfotelmatobacter sp.]|nr:MqnA/MqnD/SBP family protein [Candidatus Sulfotelmatobacter sp.]